MLREITDLLADPIVQTGLTTVVGALVTRVLLRNYPRWRLLGQLAFFAALTALLFYHGIVPYMPGPVEASSLHRILIALVKVMWWVNAAWCLIGVTRVFLIFERQPREGRLPQDIVVAAIYAGALLFIVADVFGAPVRTLIATSGVLAIILGLTLQSTLSDVFSGIALNLGRPYAIGDWLVLNNGIEGTVVDTNWRATHLLTGTNDLVVVPNSDLAKARLTNLSRPSEHGVKLSVGFRPAKPSAIAEVMHQALLSSRSILPVPEPIVQVTSLDANAVGLELSFRVADLSVAGRAKNEVFDMIYRHAVAAGLTLSLPPDTRAGAPALSGMPEVVHPGRATPLRLLDAIPLFASLTEDEKEALAATMTRRTFRKDEVLVEQGTVLGSLMVVRSGVAADIGRDQDREIEIARLAHSDFFGEGGLLTSTGEPGTIRALSLVVVYEITQDGLTPLLHDRPAIAEELGFFLAKRAAAANDTLARGGAIAAIGSAPSLAARIRRLFEVG